MANVEDGDVDVAGARRLLDAFLVKNPELEKLNAALSRFNIFRTLNIADQELRHSNTLAWLLDPAESHGLGDRFLRRFLSRILLENDSMPVGLSAARVELMDLGWIDVRREWNSIDILVRSALGRWTLLIENKIRSRESKGQLQRYKKIVDEEFDGDEIIPVFLTLDGDDASEEGKESGFISVSHVHVLAVVDGIYQQYRNRMSDDARTFLEHYLQTLRRLTMQDDELTSLCKEIYRKHREAVELIVQLGTASQVLDAVQEAVLAEPDTDHAQQTTNRVWWMTKDMARSMNQQDLLAWKFLDRSYPVYWWIQNAHKRGRLHMALEVGPIPDYEKRKSLLEIAEKHGFSFGKYGYNEYAKFTRIFSQSRKLPLDENGDPDDSGETVAKVARELLAKGDEQRKRIIDVLKEWKQ